MVTHRIPNTMLRELLAETGWTGEAFARAVNLAGAEAGLSLRYGRSSVAHWLSGVCPHPPVPDLVAEALSRKLGRPVPVVVTGLVGAATTTDPNAPPAPWWKMDAAARLVEPREIGAGGAAPVAHRGYHLSDLAVPGWAELTGTRQSWSWPATSIGKVEQWHVRSTADMVEMFSDVDLAFGGGHARRALSGYLAATVAPCLRASATPSVRRELLTAASRLTYLCGFMYFDDELHGAAQHYYLTALRLAAEAGDQAGYAVTLRALSGQAHLLGHHQQAVHLAEAAVHAGGATEPQTLAFLLGQLAVAYAGAGNCGQAVRHLLTAERHLNRVRDTPKPIGGCHAAALAHQLAEVQAKLGDRRGAIEALTASLSLRPPAERRSRAVTLARLAELQLDGGDLEAACRNWQRFLQDYLHLRSRRIDRALASMRARLRPHQNNSAVIALRRRVATRGAVPGSHVYVRSS
jgi:tetratricopeptide (TPR) repeat protein